MKLVQSTRSVKIKKRTSDARDILLFIYSAIAKHEDEAQCNLNKHCGCKETKNSRSLLFLPLLLILFNRFFQNIACRFHGHLAAVFRLEGLGLDVLAQGGAVFGVEFAH